MKILQDWLARLKPSGSTLPTVNVQNALGALLVRMAKSDREYLAVEIVQIDQILASAYHLDPTACAALRAECEQVEMLVEHTEDFANIIRESLPHQDRLTICDAIWAVLMADGIARLSEKETLEDIEKSLGIKHSDSYVIRHKDTPI